MSLRIHELAKRINMEGKELLALLKARNWVSADTKSVSSTVSKIYIEEIEKEFAGQIAATIAAAAAADAAALARVSAPEAASTGDCVRAASATAPKPQPAVRRKSRREATGV